MGARRNRFADAVVVAVSVGFGAVAYVLPLCLARLVGRWVGRLAYHVVPRVRRVGLGNLDLAFGDTMSAREKTRILRKACENVGIVAVELAQTSRIFPNHVSRLVRFEGLEHLERGRGAVCVGAHLGNWEWMAPAVASQGFAVAEVVRPLRQRRLNAFVDRARRSGNVRTVPRQDAGRAIIGLVREGWIVGLLVDQSPRRNAVPVRFFCQPTWGTIGPAMAAARTGAPVHPVAMVRERDGGYMLCIGPALAMAETGDLRADLVANTQRCQEAVEDLVRAHPEQWLWLHMRWKRRPWLEAEYAARAAGKE